MQSQCVLIVCVLGIYATFLTWSLVYEPLTTKEWPNSGSRFHVPCVVSLFQASVAAIIGYAYLNREKSQYDTQSFLRENVRQLLLISFTQSTSSPLATYSLQYVDFLTYMLAKSCKLLPILAVHLLLYHTRIPNDKKIVAVAVTFGVTLFNLGSSSRKSGSGERHTSYLNGFLPLALSLLLDGFTNATQDTLLKRNKASDKKPITGGHLMLGLNACIVLWNLLYLIFVDPAQAIQAKAMIGKDPEIAFYLLTYAACGALGQICIFFTLQRYGSLVLVMVTVTRKMFSMILSILVYGHHVTGTQWLGILIVFGGITSEALLKRKAVTKPKAQ